jgi:hypothetical protein
MLTGAPPDGSAIDELVSFPVDPPLVGWVTGIDEGEKPDCPACGEILILCQPNPQDGSGAELVGTCSYCDRLSYVALISDSMAVAILLPTAYELGRQALAALQD